MQRAAIFRRPLLLTDAVYHKKASQKNLARDFLKKSLAFLYGVPFRFSGKADVFPSPLSGNGRSHQAVISGRRLVNCIIRTAA